VRYKAELENIWVQYSDNLAQQQSRYNLELVSPRTDCRKQRAGGNALEREVQVMKDKSDIACDGE
jgi:serine/threonine-protein kinase MRCK